MQANKWIEWGEGEGWKEGEVGGGNHQMDTHFIYKNSTALWAAQVEKFPLNYNHSSFPVNTMTKGI